MKEFDVKNKWIQFGSASLSMLSILRSMAARYAFIQYNKDPGFSGNFFKSLAILFFPTVTLFICQLLAWTDKSMQSMVGLWNMVLFHPISLRLVRYIITFFNNLDNAVPIIIRKRLQSAQCYLHMMFLASFMIPAFNILMSQHVSNSIHQDCPLVTNNPIFPIHKGAKGHVKRQSKGESVQFFNQFWFLSFG